MEASAAAFRTALRLASLDSQNFIFFPVAGSLALVITSYSIHYTKLYDETAIAVRRFHKHYLKKSDDEIDPNLMA